MFFFEIENFKKKTLNKICVWIYLVINIFSFYNIYNDRKKLEKNY